LAPLGWDDLDAVPDLGNVGEDLVATRMAADLPDDEVRERGV
jgi:hypothetical protein